MAAQSCTDRTWTPPPGCCLDGGEPTSNGSSQPRLVLYNSYLDRKVPFVPAAGPDSKQEQICWYTCGPTVYDSAHVGHARNYLSFDIVRRVLEDYFGYNISFVMNVTDVDDKIILRARRNYLLESYKKEAHRAQQVYDDIRAALQAGAAKQQGKVDEAKAAAEEAEGSEGCNSKLRDELRTALAQEELMLSKVQGALAALQQAGVGAGEEALLAIGGDALAEALDKKLGATVTDPAIFRAHAAKYEAEFLEDMAALGCRPPDVLTRVSEYMTETVQYVEKIVANGMGYVANGSVYFDTQKFREGGHVYGKLNPWAVGSAALGGGDGGGGDGEKRSPADFALWKAQKPGEPAWDSPWGPGRPGWHIECSAMASSILGSTVDIHTGGEDLRFPHHDNELAQAEAYYHDCGCQQWVNYFLHSGHLGIEGLKMSKSLKNFITIRQALESFTPRQLRLLFVLQPWEKRMMYGEQAKEEMRSKESLLRNFFGNVDVVLRRAKLESSAARWDEEEVALAAEVAAAQQRVHEALCDNINTQAALNSLLDLVKAVNVYLAKKEGKPGSVPQALLLRKAAAYVTRILSCFGLVPGPGDVLGFASEGAGTGAGSDKVAAVLDQFAGFRDSMRSFARSRADHKEIEAAVDSLSDESLEQLAGGDRSARPVLQALRGFRDRMRGIVKSVPAPKDILAACDSVRDSTLVDLGVRLEDKPDGTSVWKPEDPAVLRAEMAEKRRAAAEAALRKLRTALELKSKELERFEKMAALPTPQEALADKYSRFDESSGEPTHDKVGAALEGKALDKARKDLEKQRKARAPLEKKLQEDPQLFETLRGEVARLQAELAAAEASSGGGGSSSS